MLAVVEGEDSAGMFLGEACPQQVAISLCRGSTVIKILGPLALGVGVLLALSIAVVTDRSQVKDLLKIQFPVGGPADALAGVTH